MDDMGSSAGGDGGSKAETESSNGSNHRSRVLRDALVSLLWFVEVAHELCESHPLTRGMLHNTPDVLHVSLATDA